MNRLMPVAIVAAVFLPMLGAQEPKRATLPPGPAGAEAVEVVHALFVQAQMLDNAQVMFCFPRGHEVPALFARVDGKEVRAIGRDLKPLAVAELEKRLPGYTGVVVIQAEFKFPDAFFLRVLHERSVIFVLPKKMFTPMAKASEACPAPGKPRP
jgi:hypothetical protein